MTQYIPRATADKLAEVLEVLMNASPTEESMLPAIDKAKKALTEYNAAKGEQK